MSRATGHVRSPAAATTGDASEAIEAKRPPRPERHKRKPRRGEDGKRRGEDGKRRDDDGANERPKRYQAAPRDEQRVADGPFAVLGALREKLAQTKK